MHRIFCRQAMPRCCGLDRKFFLALVVLNCFTELTGAQEKATDSRIVSEPPPNGHYVPYENAYLVPFKQQIPKTDIAFEMVPIPALSQTARPFWMATCEVTWQEYREVAKLGYVMRQLSTRQTRDAHAVDAITSPTDIYEYSVYFDEDTKLSYPAHSMTLYAAKQYSKWLSLITDRPFRLPTETEWEHACSAGEMSWIQPTPEDYAVFGDQLGAQKAVGSKLPNKWGLYDMFGNVSEWVITEFPGSKASLASHIYEIPLWISKGGNSTATVDELNVAHRAIVTSDYWDLDPDIPISCCWLGTSEPKHRVGFRLVCDFGPLDKSALKPYWDCESANLRDWVNEKVRSGRVRAGTVDDQLPLQSAELLPSGRFWQFLNSR